MASSSARAVGEQAPVALPADLPAHLADALVADLAESDPVMTSSLAAVPDTRHRRGRRHGVGGAGGGGGERRVRVRAGGGLVGAAGGVAPRRGTGGGGLLGGGAAPQGAVGA